MKSAEPVRDFGALTAAWHHGNEIGVAYAVGREGDTPARAARREGWELVCVFDIEGVTLAKQPDGRYTVVCHLHGAWAVDLE